MTLDELLLRGAVVANFTRLKAFADLPNTPSGCGFNHLSIT
jgi:hypothetical protein